ncbi:MAG: nitric oxide reductase, partial [Gammaproteobacteria bacterium]
LGEGIAIDEWDYKKQRLQKDHCRIIPMESKDAEAVSLPQRLQSQARKIRRQFEILQPQCHWVSRQSEGTELDLESYINFLADRKHGRVNNDAPVYRNLHNQSRDLSCLLLADLSLSTDAHINNHSRVIDVIRDSLYLFAEALSVTGDRFALHGFSSRNRNHIRFYKIKTFDERYSDDVRGHIEAVRPGYYTRMGTAIRYASQLLEKEASSQKLLLILTDGKPNDLDKYEGRYGIEDTRQAILEAEQKGLQPFCITVDEKAEDYLPYLFGKNSYILVRNAQELPTKLTQLYMRLTR